MTEAAESLHRQPTKLSSSSASTRTLALAVALVGVCMIVLSYLRLSAVSGQVTPLHWWAIALIAITAELMEFRVEFRREMYSFTFSEIALVLGLFLAAPRQLLIGRLIGEAVFLIVTERRQLRKVILNLAAFGAETTVLLTVHQLLGRPTDITQGRSWIVAFASVAAADVVGYLIVLQVVHWHGAPVTFRSILSIGALMIPVNTSFALVVGILIVDKPLAVLLLTGVAVFLLVAYRSYTALSQRFDSLTTLYEFTRLMSGAKRPDSVLEAILTQAKDLLRAERAEIWLTDENDFRMRLEVNDSGLGTSALEAVHGGALHRWLNDVDGARVITAASLTRHDSEIAQALSARDAIVAPITESGVVVGLVAVINRLGEVVKFQDADRMMFATLANHASIALENGRLIDRLHHEAGERRHQALHDALTGLPNRVLFGTRLDDELVSVATGHGRLAVAVMDLDGFKEINDTLGHQCGDVVLDEVAQRITAAVGAGVTVARLGGDEFALLFPACTDRKQLEAAARRVRAAVAEQIVTDGMRINVTISIGFALAPGDASDGAALLQRADVAMYSAKAGNGDGVAFYESRRDENSPRRLSLGNDLLAAIADGQLTMVFQPKVRLADMTMVGAEALVRWQHPVFGPILPEEFVPLAERTGIIDELTTWVMRTSLAQARQWRDAGRHWSLAVNVAMRNLLDGRFVAVARELLAASGVDPASLTLEITEAGVMSDTTKTIDVLERLAGLGINLSVDDFGTGHTSLSYLQQLPVTEIKIDKSFVLRMIADHNADAIVRSVLDLARNLELTAVAEGVEDRATLERLRLLGCPMAQGYSIARPMSADELELWSPPLRTTEPTMRRPSIAPLPMASLI